MVWGCYMFISIPDTNLLFRSHWQIWLFVYSSLESAFSQSSGPGMPLRSALHDQELLVTTGLTVKGISLKTTIQRPQLLLQRLISFPKSSPMPIQALGELMLVVELQPGRQHTTAKCHSNIWSQDKVAGLSLCAWTLREAGGQNTSRQLRHGRSLQETGRSEDLH